MDLDIGGILAGWAYEPGNVIVRKIGGRDGRELIQMRLDLGVLQMETSGRPDGRRPHNHESLLEYHEQMLSEHTWRTGSEEGFTLDPSICERLRAEGMMYYHRYLAEFVLGDFEATERDAQRNLRLTDFCAAYAAQVADRYMLEQYRPYVLMMCARSRGHIELQRGHFKSALAAVQRGIRRIRAFYERFDQPDMQDGASEIATLDALADEIRGQIPRDPVEELREALGRAVAEERYEDAAALRDRLPQADRTEGD
jgi:hypothetical protein